MRHWFESLAPRERALVAGGAAVAVLLMVYLIVVEPLQARRALLERGLVGQRDTLAWMQQVVPSLRGAPAAAGRGESLFAVVDRSARATVLAGALQRVEPQGATTARVWLDNASFDALVRWIATLQTEHGIAVTTMTVERTQSAGLVNARLVVERTP